MPLFEDEERLDLDKTCRAAAGCLYQAPSTQSMRRVLVIRWEFEFETPEHAAVKYRVCRNPPAHMKAHYHPEILNIVPKSPLV